MDPIAIYEACRQAAPYVLAVLLALTALAHALQAAAHAFARWAATTPTPDDDELAERLVRWADATAAALDWLGAWLPQLGFGQRKLGGGGCRPPRPPIGPLGGALLVAAALSCAGCGGTPVEQHETLNTVTDVADPTYQIVLDTCDAARNAIVDRAGTTYSQDRFAMDKVNGLCDALVEAFEGLRGSQVTARAYIDQGLGGAAASAVVEGMSLWRHLRVVLKRLPTLGTDALEAVDADDVDPETPPPVVLDETAGGEEVSP